MDIDTMLKKTYIVWLLRLFVHKGKMSINTFIFWSIFESLDQVLMAHRSHAYSFMLS